MKKIILMTVMMIVVSTMFSIDKYVGIDDYPNTGDEYDYEDIQDAIDVAEADTGNLYTIYVYPTPNGYDETISTTAQYLSIIGYPINDEYPVLNYQTGEYQAVMIEQVIIGTEIGESIKEFSNFIISNDTSVEDAVGIRCHNTESFNIQNVTIQDMDSGIKLHNCGEDIIFTGNNLSDNVRGLDIYSNNNDLVFELTNITTDSKFSGNDVGIYLEIPNASQSTVYFEYLLMHNNTTAIELTGSYAAISLDNTTIADNGTGIVFDSDTSADIENSIIHKNTNTFVEATGSTGHTCNVEYSCIEGTPLYTGTGNTNDKPDFCDKEGYEYRLIEGSPCIDAGDPARTDEIDGTRLDMGYLPSDEDIKIIQGSYPNEHWNWVSYPKLNDGDGDDDITDTLDEMEPFPSDEDHIVDMSFDAGTILTWIFEAGWDPDSYTVHSSNSYKLKALVDNTDSFLIQSGEYRLAANYSKELDLGENYVGYWLPNTQKYTVALGDQLDDIKCITAEDWYAYKQDGRWYGYTTGSGYFGTFEYGKGYVIDATEEFDLQWSDTSRAAKFSKPESELYAFDAKANYQMIEIQSIENGENALEVAVFQGEECVGASVIESYPVHMQAYTDEFNRSNELSFEVSYGRGQIKKISSVQLFNFEQNEYQTAVLHPWQNKFSLIKLEEGEYSAPSPEQLYLNNHPNPFNPSTVVSYNVPQTSSFVTLKIFNAKGQLVKTLVNGKQEQGNYSVTWNGKDNNDNAVSTGIYYSRLETARKVLNKKMVLMK